MWVRSTGRKSPTLSGAELADLGSQFEDVLLHVLRCEKWARFDDRLELAMALERVAPRRPLPGR
jgi:hypothetical protein